MAIVALAHAQAGMAQPADLPIAPATTDTYPAGVKVVKNRAGPIYANEKGVTLYGMDMRTLIRWGADPALYCKDECAKQWEPLLAPPGSKPNIAFPRGFGSPPPAPGQAAPPPPRPANSTSNLNPDGLFNTQRAPDWTIIQGASGPQWVYKSWHLVFVRKGDKPGSTAFEGAEDMTWNTLKFVPPVPKITAPQSVSAIFHDGRYVLADKDGRLLFAGSCKKACEAWSPLAAPAAGRGIGEWTVSRAGDTPQWLYRGKPVYRNLAAAEPDALPASAKVLLP
ncbi:MAG: hypothetical protein ACKOPQ_05545 [Novosphingobium sp.]